MSHSNVTLWFTSTLLDGMTVKLTPTEKIKYSEYLCRLLTYSFLKFCSCPVNAIHLRKKYIR